MSKLKKIFKIGMLKKITQWDWGGRGSLSTRLIYEYVILSKKVWKKKVFLHSNYLSPAVFQELAFPDNTSIQMNSRN